MTEFKVGDKVRETATGDEGFVCGDPDGSVSTSFCGDIYVDWVTGDDAGRQLRIDPSSIVLVSHATKNSISVEQAIDILTKAGYTVTISKTS